MQNISLFPADTFVVVNKTITTSLDERILFMLYQPLVGSGAISLYFTLKNYLELDLLSKEFTHYELFVSTKSDLKQILNYRVSLEAVGLLKTYLKKGTVNTYIYELYAPLSPYEFFSNPLLAISLKSEVGDDSYQKLVSYFKAPKIKHDQYEEISHKFQDVFASVAYVDDFSNLEDVRAINYSDLKLNTNVDVEAVLALIPEEVLNPNVNKETKELIQKLAFLYYFSAHDLEEVILNSIDELKRIDKEKLKINSCNYYKFEHKGKLPSLIYKTEEKPIKKTTNSKREKMIYTFETTSPYLFLCSKYDGASPSRSDLDLLAYLVNDVGLRPGVVNVLIDYILRINDNKLTRGFVEKVASQWKLSKIDSVEEAIKISQKEQKKRLDRKNKMPVKKEVTPAWFNQNIEEKKATTEELAEMEALLKDFK